MKASCIRFIAASDSSLASVELAQATRTGLDDVDHVLAKHLLHALRIDQADALDHAGAEVFLDALQRRWSGGLQESCAELPPLGTVVDPFSGGGDPFPGGNHRCMTAPTATRSRWPLALTRSTQEAVVRVLKGYPFNQSDRHFTARCGVVPRRRGTASRRSLLAGMVGASHHHTAR